MKIRVAATDADFRQVREFIIELQDFERRSIPRLPAGETIADAYMANMHKKLDEHQGQVLVAELESVIAGCVTILSKVSSGELYDGDMQYSLIDDLVVREEFRGKGIGTMLIEAAEKIAQSSGARSLGLSTLAGNTPARTLYSSLGFSELYVEFEKDLNKAG